MSRASRYRNPSNLHVVPISSVLNNKPITLQPNPVMQNVFSPVVPVPVLSVSSPAFPESNDLQDGFNKKRRKRQRVRKRDRKRSANKNVLQNSSALPDPAEYRWFNPNNISKNNVDAPVNKKTETEKVEVTEAEVTEAEVTEAEVTEAEVTEVEVTEAPPVEEHFEEVEVASTEGDGKRIPVGFRRTKLHYLNYKKKSFFKPKYYDFSSQRIVVNCLNIADDVSVDVDVDVVSEAEYDGYETDTYDPNEKFGKIIEIEDDENTEEEQNHDDDTEMEEDSAHIVTDETEESTPADTDKLDKHSVSAAVNETDEESSCIIVDEIKEKNIDVIMIKESTPDRKENVSLKKWISDVGIEDKNDLIQAKSLIQDKLETWESHLIGLEYLIEILDNNKVMVLKYYCVLCDEEMDVKEIPESYVINHVSGCNHITKYLEKHFPNCGFKFNENSNYDFVILQKLCEKINENLGYSFLCVTNSDYYSENKFKVKETIENASHLNDKDFKFEKCTFEKEIDSDLLKNIGDVIEDVVKKVIPENELKTTELNKNIKDKSDSKHTDPNLKKKPPAALKPKHKGNNSVSAFLRLSFAATSKLKLADKGKNKKKKSNEEQTVEKVKTHDEIKETVKSQNEQLNKENSSETIIQNKTPKKDQHIKSPSSKNIQKTESNEQQVIETITLSDTPEKDTELKIEQHEETESKKEAQDLENSIADNSLPATSKEVVPKVTKKVPVKKVIKNKEKILLKTTVHSKHCRKRILDKGIAGYTRLKMAAAKITPVRRIIAGVSDKHNVKSKSVTDNASPDVSKKIPKKIKPELKENTIPVTSNRKSKPSYNVIVPVQEAPVIDTPVTIHPNFHQNSMHQKSIENTCKNEAATISNDTSHWIPMRSSSPVLTSDISLFLKKITSKPTESSVKKRRVSKSPVRKITSPLRVVSKSHSRRYSKSPHRRRDSKSPVRRKSRSPVRRSRSPIRKRSRSPQRRRSRSPQRHRSKSPQRHRSKSSQRHRSKSPIRRRSKSPVRRRSRSPRRRSRSPIRHRSRSPRRRSRTPLRKQSRSPLRRYSRSPIRRHSRSPLRRSSRSPVKRRSRSPYRRQSRSPIKRRSRSPYRRHSRSPVKNFSNNSIGYRNVRETNADFGQSSRSREYYSPEEHPRRNMFNISKDPGLRESDIRKRDESRMLHSPRINKSDRYKSQSLSSSRGISDLDPVSDEDESIYFDKHMLSEDTNVSPSSKIMFSKLLQKFSAANNQSDPNLNNLLQFIESHKAEFEEFIALKSSSKPEKMKIDQNIQQQNLLLQQFLLANLASRIQEAGPSVSNIPFIPPQPQFVPENTSFRFGPPAMNMQAPAPIPPIPPQPAPIQPRFFPPNVNVPPPQLFQPSTQQPIQDFTPKPKPTPEVAFKDLKATVSKLFGANEGGMKQGAKPQMSSFVSTQIPDPEKWDLSHPNAPKFNAPIGSKNVFSSPVKNVNFSGGHDNRALREQVPSHHNNNAPGQFSSSSGNNRAQISNLPVPPPDAKVTFCDQPRSSSKGNLFPVVNPNFSSSTRSGVSDVKVSLAQRLASVLVKIGMVDVPAPLLQEMLMKIGAFSSSPRQDISENEILSILKRLGYLS